jgi:hypothetical protein
MGCHGFLSHEMVVAGVEIGLLRLVNRILSFKIVKLFVLFCEFIVGGPMVLMRLSARLLMRFLRFGRLGFLCDGWLGVSDC